jgi:hypothetical protein
MQPYNLKLRELNRLYKGKNKKINKRKNKKIITRLSFQYKTSIREIMKKKRQGIMGLQDHRIGEKYWELKI